MQWFWSAVAERSGDTALAWTGPAVCQMSSTLDGADQSGVAASLCHRTPKSSRAEIIPGDTDRLESLRSIKCIHTHTTTCACATRSLLRPLLALSVAANCSVAWPPCAAEAHVWDKLGSHLNIKHLSECPAGLLLQPIFFAGALETGLPPFRPRCQLFAESDAKRSS